MPLTPQEIYDRSNARAKAVESQKRRTASHRERVRTAGFQQRSASNPSVVNSQLRIDRQKADQEFKRSQFAATQASRIDAENRRIARQDQQAQRRLYGRSIDSVIPSGSSGDSFGQTTTGRAVSSGGQSIGGGIFRVVLVIVGLAILYLIVSNGGQGGTTLTNGLSSILSWFTSPTNMFASTGASSGGIQGNAITPPNTLVPSNTLGSTLGVLPNNGSGINGAIGVAGAGNNPAQILPGMPGWSTSLAGLQNLLDALQPAGSPPWNLNQSIFSPTTTGGDALITDTLSGVQYGGTYNSNNTFTLNGKIFVMDPAKGLLGANIPSIAGRTFGITSSQQTTGTFQASPRLSGDLINALKS